MKTFQKRAMVAMFSGLALAAVACKKDDPNAQSAANANGQYPQQQQQYPQQQQQYPDQQQQQQQQQQYPQQQQQQPATGTLATPGPLALPCSADSACLLHKCNTAAGKCAFPCASDFDCNPGNKCNPGVGACFPG